MTRRDDNGKGIFAEVAASMTPKQRKWAMAIMLVLAALWYITMGACILVGFICGLLLLVDPSSPSAMGRGFAGVIALALFTILKQSMRKPSIDG